EPCECLVFELADPFAGQVELVTDRAEGPGFAVEAEPQFEDAALPVGERVEGAADLPASQRPFGRLERVWRVAMAEQISELTVPVEADGLVKRERRGNGADRLLNVLQGEAGRLRELVAGRVA